MQKERPIGTVVIGCTLILSNIFVWFHLAESIARIFAIQPDIRCYISLNIIPTDHLLYFSYFFEKSWVILTFLCALLILRLNNAGRIIIIILSGLKMIMQLSCSLTELKMLRFSLSSGNFIYSIIVLFSFIIPALYIIYFSRYSIKKQFRKDEFEDEYLE